MVYCKPCAAKRADLKKIYEMYYPVTNSTTPPAQLLNQ